ncbi:TPA: hypothetical protein JBH59_02915 [Legionella pneumophila]|uniref:DUF7168 domain-containing protein n=1 Tax=Legionella pneumophila TaxID=446 RepID=UPI001A33645E|nr:hypothetical protein [Legionella pneumophila]MDI9826313.1 hypothetical protein [Legionella pneumophila]HAU0908757.1 hypothetical protein [Legionella pneumophila]HAU1359043.1 hypothetical protein [Legionella pneumophila]HAU1458293.1 hypothetical protein [Legionella pneumophila]HBD7231674.1 hypothetical protein [Legionella pneumophila]
MANKKRRVSLDDYVSCYHYFERAIQNNRFMSEETNNSVRIKAIQAFSELKNTAHDEETVHLFQLWLDEFVDSQAFSRCYRALNQKKYLVEKTLRTITISDEAYNALKDLAHQKNISLSQAIVDGCTLLRDKNNESIIPSINTNTLKPVNTNLISLFGDALDESSDEKESGSEFDFFDFEEVREWPRKPEGYDFRSNESYKKYRKHIERLTIKKTDEKLLDTFNKTINYYLTEDNCHQIGPHLLSIRQELLNQKLLSKEFNPELFEISKGFNVGNLTMDDYADELLFLLGYIFGCTTASITAGNRQPTVFAGHPNHVQLAYKTFHYLDAFLNDEVKSFAARCHKNTKRKNRTLRAKWHGCHLVGVMLNSIVDDEEDYMLLPQSEYEQLSQYSFKKVHEYFDENEPLGGWWDPKKHPFR